MESCSGDIQIEKNTDLLQYFEVKQFLYVFICGRGFSVENVALWFISKTAILSFELQKRARECERKREREKK